MYLHQLYHNGSEETRAMVVSGHTVTWVRGPLARIVQGLGARATGPHRTVPECAGLWPASCRAWVRGPLARIVKYPNGCAFGMTTLYTDEPDRKFRIFDQALG